MAKRTTKASAAFPSREEAEQALQRLSSGGFSRNSIDLDRRRDGSWTVSIHTSERNLERVEELLNASSPMYAFRQQSVSALQALTGNPLVLAGAAVLAALAAYSLLPRNRRAVWVREFPGRVRDTVQDLPNTAREAARSVQETLSELPQTVRDAVGASPDAGQRKP